jgi:hypothetical protein
MLGEDDLEGGREPLKLAATESFKTATKSERRHHEGVWGELREGLLHLAKIVQPVRTSKRWRTPAGYREVLPSNARGLGPLGLSAQTQHALRRPILRLRRPDRPRPSGLPRAVDGAGILGIALTKS